VKVGVVVSSEMRAYKHTETRGGVPWEIALGAGHLAMVRDMFAASFVDPTVFASLDEAKAASGLVAIFEPRIEQYSFATARDTGGNYYAVTILYRIHLYNAAGEKADSFSLTGYGNALAGAGSDKPLIQATSAAMRDAAAKFMVQFPEQKVAAQLNKGEPLLAASATPQLSAFELIQAVSIRE
jgi:hypothetical protein